MGSSEKIVLYFVQADFDSDEFRGEKTIVQWNTDNNRERVET